MKRFLLILLSVLLLLTMFGCTQEEALEKPVNFYYRRSNIEYKQEGGVIAAEQRESLGHETDVRYLLSEYLKGPTSGGLQQVFPEGMTIVSMYYEDKNIKMTFSFHLAELTGMDLTIACACITMTCMELTDVTVVRIRAENTTLDGAEFIEMSAASLLLVDFGKENTQ